MPTEKIIRTYLKNTFKSHREEPSHIHYKGDEAICAMGVFFIAPLTRIAPLYGVPYSGTSAKNLPDYVGQAGASSQSDPFGAMTIFCF